MSAAFRGLGFPSRMEGGRASCHGAPSGSSDLLRYGRVTSVGGAEVRGQVLLLGDSLTVACEVELGSAATRAGVDLTIAAEIGRSIRSIGPILGATGPRSDIVIALGTNDHSMATGLVDQTIDATVSAFDTATRLWWVDLALTRGRARRFNGALEDAARRHHQLSVIRWSEAVTERDELLADDGVHLSAEGRSARAALIVEAVLR